MTGPDTYCANCRYRIDRDDDTLLCLSCAKHEVRHGERRPKLVPKGDGTSDTEVLRGGTSGATSEVTQVGFDVPPPPMDDPPKPECRECKCDMEGVEGLYEHETNTLICLGCVPRPMHPAAASALEEGQGVAPAHKVVPLDDFTWGCVCGKLCTAHEEAANKHVREAMAK